MKITTQQAIDICNGLSALDGAERIVKDGKHERIVRVPYKLGGGFRLLVARNTALLQPIVEAYRHARNGLIAEIGGEGSKIETPEQMQRFLAGEREQLKTEHEVALGRFKSDQLSLGTNEIPGSVIAALAPLIEDLDGETEVKP